MDTKLAGFIGGGGDDTTLVALSAHYDRFAFKRWIEKLFHRDEKSVHIDVEDGAGMSGVGSGGHAKGILAAGTKRMAPRFASA
jgi:hypothetical protein